jgi:hypothetical protein
MLIIYQIICPNTIIFDIEQKSSSVSLHSDIFIIINFSFRAAVRLQPIMYEFNKPIF